MLVVLEPKTPPNGLGGEGVSVLLPNGLGMLARPELIPVSFDGRLGDPNPKNGEPAFEEALAPKRELVDELVLGAPNIVLLLPESPSADDAKLFDDGLVGRVKLKADWTGAGGGEDTAGGMAKSSALIGGGIAGVVVGACVEVGPADGEGKEKGDCLVDVALSAFGTNPGPVDDGEFVIEEKAPKPEKPVGGTGGGGGVAAGGSSI